MALIDEKMRESCLGWFGHVQRKAINALVRKSEFNQVEGMEKKHGGRPKVKFIVV